MALTSRPGTRLLWGAALVFAGYQALWGGEYSAFHLLRLDREQVEARAQLIETRAEVDSLRAVAAQLENDDAAVERIARERFGMIREGELLYRFVPVDAATPSAPGDPGR